MNENTEKYKYELDAWEGGTLVSPAKADLTTGIVTPAVYEGNTPITPERLEIMNQGIKKLYEEGAISKDIYIGPEEEAPEEAKIIIDKNLMATPTNIEKMVDNKLSIKTQQDIITNGEPVKCGYKIDGKDVYVKRYAQLFNGSTATFSHGLENVIITDISGYYANADFSTVFPLPSIRTGFTDYTTEFYISGGNVNINVANVGRDGFTAYINIYFTYNEEV